jgi:hypothetical protein
MTGSIVPRGSFHEIMVAMSSIQDPYGYFPVVSDQGPGYVESIGTMSLLLSFTRPFSIPCELSNQSISTPLCAFLTWLVVAKGWKTTDPL